MKKVIFAGIIIGFVLLIMTGCTEQYQTQITNDVYAENQYEQYGLHVTKHDNLVSFTVTTVYGILYVVEAEECMLRENNTNEQYANYGDYRTMVFKDLKDEGNYSFGFYYNNMSLIYDFSLEDLEGFNDGRFIILNPIIHN